MKSRTAGALPHKQRTAIRRIVMLDIENLNGGAVENVSSATIAWAEIAHAIHLRADEQVVIGVGPSSLLATGVSQPAARKVLGRGLDGADHALIRVMKEERLASRFNEVIIASGDGIFSDIAAELGARGMTVTVVAREGRLSTRLRLAAGHVVVLPTSRPAFGEAA